MRCTCFGAQAPAKIGVCHKKMMRFGTASSGIFFFQKEKGPHSLQCRFMVAPPRARRGNFPARRNRCEIQLLPGGMEKTTTAERDVQRVAIRNGKWNPGQAGCHSSDYNLLPRQGTARAPQCLFPPGESARLPGNNCCRHSREPRGRVGAFPAGTGRPRGSAEGCPAGSRPAGAR